MIKSRFLWTVSSQSFDAQRSQLSSDIVRSSQQGGGVVTVVIGNCNRWLWQGWGDINRSILQGLSGLKKHENESGGSFHVAVHKTEFLC